MAKRPGMPVVSVLILLACPQGVPAAIPRRQVGHYDIGSTRTSHPFRVVRLWEVDPALVLETQNPRLLPWALLMKSSDEQVRGIAAMVACQGDEESVGRFFTLGSVRYDRDALQEMLGGREMGMIRAILDGSSLVEEEREKRRRRKVEWKAEWRGPGRGPMQGQVEQMRQSKVPATSAQEELSATGILDRDRPDLECRNLGVSWLEAIA